MKSRTNYRILIPIFIFCVISIISIGFITKNAAQVEYSSNWLHYVQMQTIGFAVGFVIIFVAPKVEIPRVKWLVNLAYFTLLVMLIMLITGPGFFVKTINGARGWWRLFPGGPSIQPVEFMKIAMIVKLAFISHDHLSNPESLDRRLILDYSIYGLIPIALVMIQPDMGGAMLLGVPWLFMLLVSIKNKSLLRTMTLAIFATILLFVVFLILPQGQELLIKITPIQEYQLERLDAWLQPFESSIGLQLQQSLILMGSAGVNGHGVLYNAITIPEPHTDMIFAKIVGMFGYGMGFFIIIMYFSMIAEMLNVARRVKEPLYKLIGVGIASLFIIQVTENIGMIVGILPITGIVLPFLSYGVSALISYAMTIGVIINIDQHIEVEE